MPGLTATVIFLLQKGVCGHRVEEVAVREHQRQALAPPATHRRCIAPDLVVLDAADDLPSRSELRERALVPEPATAARRGAMQGRQQESIQKWRIAKANMGQGRRARWSIAHKKPSRRRAAARRADVSFLARINFARDARPGGTRGKERSTQHSLHACQTGTARTGCRIARMRPYGAAARDASCQHQQASPYASLERHKVALRDPAGPHRQQRGAREAFYWPKDASAMR